MKNGKKLLVTATMLLCLLFAACGGLSAAEKEATGDWRLADIELTVTAGALGVNQEAHTLKATALAGWTYSDKFGDIEVDAFRSLYASAREATVRLTSDTASGGYRKGTLNETSVSWKGGKDRHLLLKGVSLYGFSDDGAQAVSAAVTAGYVTRDGKLWFTLSGKTYTLKYVWEKSAK